jgi:hypothetical protein
VYRLFVFRAGPRIAPRRADTALESLVNDLSQPVAVSLQTPLAQLFERAQHESGTEGLLARTKAA